MFIFLKESKGQLIALIPMVIVLMGLAFSISYLYLSAQKQMAKQHYCLDFGIRLQTVYAELAEKIEALNPRAKTLQTQEKLAWRAVQVAPNAQAKAAALAYYKLVKYQQKLHRFKQQSLFNFYESRAKIKSFQFFRKNTYQKINLPLRLHFRAQPKGSDSPVYVKEKAFDKKQTLVLSWQDRDKKNRLFKGHCQVKMVKEKKWFAKIKGAKAL